MFHLKKNIIKIVKMICYTFSEGTSLILAKIGNFAKKTLILKIENTQAKLKNSETRNCSIYWIKIQFKQKRNLLCNSKLPNKPFLFNYINWEKFKKKSMDFLYVEPG